LTNACYENKIDISMTEINYWLTQI
jgi:hypothetical protein